MTGAPMPAGADAVIMVEYTRREGSRVVIDQPAQSGQFINPRGCECAAGETVLHAGKRLDYTDVALLAAFGRTGVKVYRRPSVAIIPTGDEIVEVHEYPARFSDSQLQFLVARRPGAACWRYPSGITGSTRQRRTHPRMRRAGP